MKQYLINGSIQLLKIALSKDPLLIMIKWKKTMFVSYALKYTKPKIKLCLFLAIIISIILACKSGLQRSLSVRNVGKSLNKRVSIPYN
ncbi:unnamed protein product [Moneuplotes crassus]|uniref:Uncharacterized protein n=1 Tax=Euplotes crassus TaxID=5936 RepID=A0AAD2D9E9_EUPCR|nr:unnamed protein product [Moneuplotes crassus]